MDLRPLYTLAGTAVVERLGKVQDGERLKIEFRGTAAPDSPVAGKAHGSAWILVGPLGPGETSAVQELVTATGERIVLELRGYTINRDGGGMEIRASGLIRTSAAHFAEANGRIALVVQTVSADNAVSVRAYQF